MTTLALDAMGGDRGPEVLVTGALQSLKDIPGNVILVGDEKQLREILHGKRYPKHRIEIVHAPDVVGMDVKAKDSLKMRESSILVAADLVKSGHAAGIVSAGNTAAAAAATLIKWRTLKGVLRPAIGEFFPTQKGVCFFLDVGATVDCKPRNLVQFATMGSVFCREVMGIRHPRVGLLNIGEEESKGNEAAQAAHQLLKQTPLNFTGNAEGRDVVSGKFDVVACDGFTGNVVLKFGESVASLIFTMLRDEIKKSPFMKLGALTLRPAFRRFKKKVDSTEYGGAPLLGLNGVCIICHGTSNSRAIANALIRAEDTVTRDINRRIIEAIEKNQKILGVAV